MRPPITLSDEDVFATFGLLVLLADLCRTAPRPTAVALEELGASNDVGALGDKAMALVDTLAVAMGFYTGLEEPVS